MNTRRFLTQNVWPRHKIFVPDCCVPRIRTGPAHRRVPRGGRWLPQHHEDGGSDEHSLRASSHLTQGKICDPNLWCLIHWCDYPHLALFKRSSIRSSAKEGELNSEGDGGEGLWQVDWVRHKYCVWASTKTTGWPFRLCQTSHWHQNKSYVLVWGPCTKTQLCFEVNGRFGTTWMVTL